MSLLRIVPIHLYALAFSLFACSDSGPDVEVQGVWRRVGETGPTSQSLCQVFCPDGLLMNRAVLGDGCTDNWGPRDPELCFPYSVEGSQLEVDGEGWGKVELDASNDRLTITDDEGGVTYERVAEFHTACSSPCVHGGIGEPLR
jgi:hypothetical protein